MNRLPCPACKTILPVPDNSAGIALTCPTCGKVLRVSLAQPRPAAPPAKRPEPSRPRRRPPRRSGAGLVAAIVAAILVVAGAAGVGGYYLLGDSTLEPSARQTTARQVARVSKDRPPAPTVEPAPEPPAPMPGEHVAEQTPPLAVSEKPAPEKPAPEEVSEKPKQVPPPPPPDEAPDPPAPAQPENSKPAKPDPAESDPIPKEHAALAKEVLTKINVQRLRGGALAVPLDGSLSKACALHARYLVWNARVVKAEGMNIYREERKLPGYTERGAKAAETAHIDTRDPLAAVDHWIASPAHRQLLLSPRLRAVGLGLERSGPRAGWTSVFSLSLNPSSPAAKAVIYPADQETGVPVAFPGNEVPDPIPDARERIAGYPVTVTFPRSVKVEKAAGQIEDEGGKEVEAWFSSPEQPANKKYVAHQSNTICLLAKKPLEPGRRYTVRVAARAGGKPWESVWTFVTLGDQETRQELETRVVGRINAVRRAAGIAPVSLDRELVRACLSHADYLVRNLGEHPDLNKNEERPDLPGYTEQGHAIARMACIRVGGGPDDAVDWLLASFLNRHFVLNPLVRQIGLGSALPEGKGGRLWVFHLATSGFPLSYSRPILFPADNQQAVPLTYPANERPSPVPNPSRPAGFAITALLLQPGPIQGVKAKLTDADGKEVSCWLSTPEKPLVNGTHPSLVGLIPQAPLAEEQTYKVSLTASAGGRPIKRQWSFTTRKKGESHQDAMATRVVERVNHFRKKAGLKAVTLDDSLSHGCLLHARYLAANADSPAVQGLGVHREDPTLPSATPAGAKAGRASVITYSSDPLSCVDDWINTLYHRVPLLSPELKRIGFAALPIGKDTHWYTVLDAGNGK